MGTSDTPSFQVTITRKCKRLADYDNVWVKGILDGLVKAGLLPDDSPKYLGQTIVKQEKTKGEPETVIKIERIE